MRQIPRFTAVALVLVVASGTALAKDDDAKAKTELATELGAYAKACAEAGGKTAAEAAIAEGEALGTGAAAALADAQTALNAVAEDTVDAAAQVEALRKIAAPKIAKAYDKLAAALVAPDAPARAEGAVVAGLRWEASKPRLARAQRIVDEGFKGNRPWAAARALAAMRLADPAGASKYDRLELAEGMKGQLMLGSPDHPLLAYVALPKDWQKGKTYPVFVGAEGAGCGFLGYFNAAKSTRGSRSAIVVVPCGFTNTNALDAAKYPFYDPAVLKAYESRRMDFDGPGMDKLLEIITKRFGGDERVFLTGFSGGGKYCYWKLFMDPAHVRGAAPACANFDGQGVSSPPAPGADGGPVVKLMTGANDEHRDHVFGQTPGIEGQTDAAEAKLKELGYQHVSRVQLQAGHSPLHAEVWKFIDEVLGKK